MNNRNNNQKFLTKIINNDAINKAKQIFLNSTELEQDYSLSDYETVNEIRIGFEKIDLINKIIKNTTVVLDSNLNFFRLESYSRDYTTMPSPPTIN